MKMITQNMPANPNTASIVQEIEFLTIPLRQFIDQQVADHKPESHAYRLLVEAIAGELTTAAQHGESYTSARQVIQSHQHMVALLDSTLNEMLTNLERMEQTRLRREQYSLRWWEQTVQALQQALTKDAEAAFQQWIMIYAQALVDWELETCRRLVSIPFSYPSDQLPYILLIRHGDAALQNKDYPSTLLMLNHLVDRLSEAMAEDQQLLCALLSIFIGRIHLYQMNQPELARRAFDRATALAPRDGRPLAAQGHASLAQGETGWAEANQLFSRAVELSPDQPEGYVGKAMLAEARLQWSEADEWYKTAIQAALDELDLLQFLSKLLAPGSGRLYLHIARQLLADNAPDHALAAVEPSLELGMDDGSSYPSRSAIALKADILLAVTGPGRSPQEAKTIADLYFDAGKYYTWNNEFQTAVDLLKKGRDLDGQNALMLFYLADNLRALNWTVAPPYFASATLAGESLATWEAGIALGEAITPDTAWIYIARSLIAKQLAFLPQEDKNKHYWQAILFDEQALLLNEYPSWWADLSDSYNGLGLYANMLHVSHKAEKDDPDDILALEERAKVLINTGQFEPAESILNKLIHHDKVEPNVKPVYQSWQALVDYYQGNDQEALKNLEPILKQSPDDPWVISLRADIRNALGEYQAAMEDEQWIWAQRTNPKYKDFDYNFARSAFSLRLFSEAIDRFRSILESASTHERDRAHLYIGLSHLASGDFKAADEHLFKTLETPNPRLVRALIMSLQQLQQRASGEGWPLEASMTAHLNQSGGILDLARSKQEKMKTYEVDPIKEMEAVLSSPVTGQPGSWSWLAAQAGLGRLHLEADHLEAAMQAYQALSLYPQQVPEARIGLKRVHDGR